MSTRGRDANEQPYTGSLGATRHEPAFLAGADGVARRVEVVRVVNSATDPKLAASALDGTLHRVDNGTYLAVPYVFHDPVGLRFALVVPVARAHEELSLRAELLTQLAADTSAPLPKYVREARVVIGMDGLQRLLGEAGHARERAELEGRAEAVAQREERLRDRAEDVTRREDELSQRSEEIDVQKSDLAVREQELEQRFTDLVAREEAVSSDERAIQANKSALLGRERMLDAREDALNTREQELTARELEIADHHAAEARATEAIEAEPIDAGDDANSDGDDDARAAHAPESRGPEASDTIEAEELEHDEVASSTSAPGAALPAAWIARGQDGYAAVVDGEVRLWARASAEQAARVAQGGSTLVLQVDPESGLPLALLGVLGAGTSDRIARAVLDTTRPDDRAVVETLARDFRVRLELVSSAGRALGSYAVADQCEPNAQLALSVLSKREAGSEDVRRAESERLVRSGVAMAGGERIERAIADESTLAQASGVERAVEACGALLDAKALERFVLVSGVPAARIESFSKRVILAALRCGVLLPAPLVARALEVGIASDEKTLVTRALTAFARTSEAGLDAVGRTRADASRAWGPLIEWAERVSATVPDAARSAMRALFDPDDPEAALPPDPRACPSEEAVAAMADDELGRWIDHPAASERVARAMARRDPVRFAESLARSLRLLPETVAPEIAAAMVPAGDALGDVWTELLASRRMRAAAMAAVATAVVKLRRGLNPMIQRALLKDNAEWRLFAWAAGEFGAAAVKAVARIENADPDRLSWVLAHAVRSGGGREVEKTRSGAPASLADAAARAVGRVDEARAYDVALRKGTGSTDVERVAGTMLVLLSQAETGGAKRGAATPGGS